MFEAMEDFFNDGGRDWPMDLLGGRAWRPAVDVEETEHEYVFQVELPGLAKEDVKIEMRGGMLVISGERKEQKEEKGHHCIRHELHVGQFQRAFSMPDDADPDKIKAAYKHGILTVTVKRLETAKPKVIPIDVE